MDLDDLILFAVALRARRRRRRCRPQSEPLQFAITRRPTHEWLNSPTLLFNSTGLRLETIHRLCSWLRDNTTMDNGTGKIPLEQKLLMFLHICRKGAGYRETQITFNHSTDTISRAFHQILRALVKLHKEVVRQPQSSDPTPSEIRTNPKLYPYFKDCIGAVDGTHIAVKVPTAICATWRNRKGFFSQNVFTACSFNLRFTFVYPGWEGSAHDSTIAGDAYFKGLWQPPRGKYFLADAGYPANDFYLTPYNKVRYHLREQATTSQRPQNHKELFNLRHAQVRNAVERIFGVVKKKFKILSHPAEFGIETQVDLVLALTALYNFISDIERVGDEDFNVNNSDSEEEDQDSVQLPVFSMYSATAKEQMNNFRDEMAMKMWNDYQSYTNGRVVSII
jgi:hypothetical protein